MLGGRFLNVHIAAPVRLLTHSDSVRWCGRTTGEVSLSHASDGYPLFTVITQPPAQMKQSKQLSGHQCS